MYVMVNTTLTLTVENIMRIAALGTFGDSYNDIITRMLDELEKK